jgi:hypothetical protein
VQLPSFFKSRKWFVFGVLALLFPLFQNMSPWEDIRLWAPAKPNGYFADPNAAYIPMNFHGGSLGDVGQSLLNYNFGEMAHRWESQLNHWGPDTYTHDDLFGVSSDLSKDDSGGGGQFRWGLPNPSLMRLSYLGTGNGDYKVTCDVGPGIGGAKFAFSTKLDSHVNLEMSHQTSDRQSQIHVDWDW